MGRKEKQEKRMQQKLDYIDVNTGRRFGYACAYTVNRIARWLDNPEENTNYEWEPVGLGMEGLVGFDIGENCVILQRKGI
jgi:hypothetical protein